MNDISRKNLVCGLTGSIACGKSTVTKFIRNAGIPVVDADVVAREVVAPGSDGLEQVISAFGEQYRLPNGMLDRKALGALVASNADKLSLINSIMYPLISAESSKQINALCTSENPIVFYDAALIIEMGNADKFRPLVVVWTPLETQIQRLMTRNGIDEDSARRWIGLQLSSDEKVKHADYVIKTTGTLDELQVDTVFTLNRILNGLN